MVAVLDDEQKFRQAVGRLLESHGFRVVCYASAPELLTANPAAPYDCLLLDLDMNEFNGFAAMAALNFRCSSVPIIVITGKDEPGQSKRVARMGAVEYLVKPVDEAALVAAIERALEKARPAEAGCAVRT